MKITTKGLAVIAVLLALIGLALVFAPKIDKFVANKTTHATMEVKRLKGPTVKNEFTLPDDEQFKYLEANQDKIARELGKCKKVEDRDMRGFCLGNLYKKYPGLYASLVIAEPLVPEKYSAFFTSTEK
ncbi:MAG TPA: hypothetical protein P5096_02480 [Patescibacteria group bacterium]|nr:hypothetical protein [Patescibacteria group bacterium]